jgi:hypothetical protein
MIAAGLEAKTHRSGQVRPEQCPMPQSVVQHEILRAVKQELRTYQLLNWMGFQDSLADVERNKVWLGT